MRPTRREIVRSAARIVTLALAGGVASRVWSGANAAGPRVHRVAIQVDENDRDIMDRALNNAEHVIEYYHRIGEEAQVEIVAYGPGLHMLREDTSPVRERISQLAATHPSIAFSACGNTKAGMEKREGKPIPIVPQAAVVPSGIVRLMELEEQGWSYVRP